MCWSIQTTLLRIRCSDIKSLRTAQLNSMVNQYTFSGKLCCGECGEIYRKYVEHSGKPSERTNWKCKKYIYKNRVQCRCGVITDEQIKEAFISAANHIISKMYILDRKFKVASPPVNPEFKKLDQRVKELESDGRYSSKKLSGLIFRRAMAFYYTTEIKDYEHTTEKMKQNAINDISSKCEMNIDKMYEHYDDMVEILFEMHEKLVDINFCNRTNSELCYGRFLKQIKNVIEMIPIDYFENSRKIVMEWTELDKSMVLYKQLISLFELMNNVDITLDYYSSGLIKIDIMGLSDGYEMLSNLYAAIHKCFKLNNPGIDENIVLILDEPDVFMHPEWARRFIKNLIEFINDEFATNTFQIIIASVVKRRVLLLRIS